MKRARWSERSLTSWVTLGMALAVAPLVLSAIVVHVRYNGQALAAFDDVSTRYRDQHAPLQDVELALWEAAVPVDEYLEERDPRHLAAYRAARVVIERGFARLRDALVAEPALVELVNGAARDWRAADQIATGLLAHPGAPGDPRAGELADQLAGHVAAASDKLRAADDDLSRVLEADHARAQLARERSWWASLIAGIVSLLLLLAGVAVISRIMLANVRRLVEGARKFAQGDRGHRIEISVPPELREVADEFNRMIAKVHEAEAALAAEARQDALTGLDNRRSFDDALAAAFARARRFDEPFCVVALDVDHFKKVNDTHGHAAGDDVLRMVGRTLKATVREVDRAFRIGGEEFVILLPAVGAEGARIAAERLRAAIAAARVSSGGAEIRVTSSFGVAEAGHAEAAADLLRAADEALYASKTGGRNQVTVATTR